MKSIGQDDGVEVEEECARGDGFGVWTLVGRNFLNFGVRRRVVSGLVSFADRLDDNPDRR